ncbi:DUF4185 domain-containing protein [Janibacter corallicola]|uniref:DUF4185 domain-containing protein n=1 Tax=Janibacter corallicola TaxID=415212 RepID=UPI000837288E|nr:DUF4185 domain-containing protein [Janibacter corallicola]
MLLAVVVIGEVAWAAFVLAGSEDLEPHEVPAVVAADPVVAESVARQYNGLPGAPFDLRAVADEDAAHSALADGSARAALVVALDGTKDRLLLASGNDDTLDDAIRQRVEHAEQRIGRGVTVDVVGPTDADERREAARLAVALAMVVGFLIAVGTSLRAGPVAPGLRQGLRRMLAIGALSLLCGGVIGALALHGDAWAVVLVPATVAGTSAVTTLALEALFGWAGTGLAVVAFFATGAPVLARVDPHLVGEPWAGIASLGLPGAGLEVATELSLRGGLPTSPVAVILVWLATAPLVIVLARVVRRHREVPAPDHDHGGHHIGGVRGWRIRVLGVVAPLTAAMLVLTVVVPHAEVAAAPRRASLAATADCVRSGSVTSVADLNRIAEMRGTDEFRGGDVGADALLQDGRRAWLFGDTLREGVAGSRYVRNSMLLTDKECIRAVVLESDGALIPDRPGGGENPVGYWPMSTVVDRRAGYDLLYVTTQRVRTTGSDAFGFTNLGLSIAVFVVPVGGTPQLLERRDIGPDRSDRKHPTWGAATTLTGRGDHRWLYVFGTANPGTDEAWGYSLRVARVRPDDFLDPSRWRYWDGSTWSGREDDATEMIPARDGVSQTLSVFTQNGRWYALSKRNDLLGNDITVWSSDAPTGPWSSGTSVKKVPKGGTGQVRYMPLAHPTLFPKEGSVVTSYSNNDTDSERVAADPLRYRPHFVRVPLPQ